MNILLSFLFATTGLVQAEIDWNTVFPNDLPNPAGNPNRGEEISARIVGGTEVIPHSRPFQVALLLPVTGGRSFCGGSLISKKTVLTAAHCVDHLTGPALVILGAHNIRQKEVTQVRMRSYNVIIHPKWNRNGLVNDVALIILPSEVELDNNINIINLPPKGSYYDYLDQNATASGWGRTSDGFRGISPVLREVTVPIISNFWCRVTYLGTIIDSHICASGLGGKSSCNGDSGGPLVINGVQIGIVSFGIIFGCEVGWPAVFARVTSFNDWIRENMVTE